MVWAICDSTLHKVGKYPLSQMSELTIKPRALSDGYAQTNLAVYMTGDGSEVYEDVFFKVAKDSDGKFRPTLVLVGIRLGIHRITPVYWEALKASLQMPQSVGIAGWVR